MLSLLVHVKKSWRRRRRWKMRREKRARDLLSCRSWRSVSGMRMLLLPNAFNACICYARLEALGLSRL
jgi:hypothetical protein